MTKWLLSAVFGLTVFGVSATLSWWLQGHGAAAAPAEHAAAPPAEGSHAPPATAAAAKPHAAGSATGELPVAVRPKPVSVEEIFRLGENLRHREEMLAERGREMDKERTRMKLGLEDVRREQQELESLQTRVQSLIGKAEQLLGDLAQKRQQLSQDKQKAEEELQKIKAAGVEYKQGEQKNIKQMAGWFQKMEPEAAAEQLRGLANSGKLDTVVQLLADMEDRDVAKILAVISDSALVDQLTEKFAALKRPAKSEAVR